MHTRDLIICSVSLVLCAALLIVAAGHLDYINAQREDLKLVMNEPLDNAPPSLAFATVAMGAFRGLVVDVLWMRADKMKEEGQFFDARQLAEWITTLQPRFGAVWAFQAWNMAYNISVAIPASQADQRWRWVKNGYELLRDKGIPLNPKDIQLYRELGWTFQHKIGGITDDDHKYYKVQLAEAMAPLLSSADNKLGAENNEYYERLAGMPARWRQIAADPNVARLIEGLRKADSSFTEGDDFVNSYLSLRQNPARFKPAAFETIDSFRGTPALRQFDLFAKAYSLRTTWKLEPALMDEINKAFGPVDFNDPNLRYPLDWRHADSHAIYWGVKALKVASKDEGREITTHESNSDRLVAQSLQDLFRNGKMYIFEMPVDANAVGADASSILVYRDVFLRPDLRMFDSYNKAELATLEKYRDDRGRYESMQNGHRNMLRNAVLSFYMAGHQGMALRIFNELRKLYPLPEFNVSLDEYAHKRFLDEMDGLGIHDATEQVTLLLRQSYYLFAIRSDDEAAGREGLAKEIYEYYNRKYDDTTRINLPPLPRLRYMALVDFLSDEEYPSPVRGALLDRIRIERPDLFKELQDQEERLQKESEGAPQ